MIDQVDIYISPYATARSNANDVISIYKNLSEQINLLNVVEIYIDPETK